MPTKFSPPTLLHWIAVQLIVMVSILPRADAQQADSAPVPITETEAASAVSSPITVWKRAMDWLSRHSEEAEQSEQAEVDRTPGSEANSPADVPNDRLQFAFDGTPWREVLKWLADKSDLALHISELPTGSFTYSDDNWFTHQEAMDRVNLFLLPQGFTLVRSGRLLSVINLSDPRSMQQLDALAPLVTTTQLEQMANHEVAKCFFPLGEFEPEEGIQELSPLNLMTTPSVFSKTNQLLITDTIAKLKQAHTILAGFQRDTMDDGTIVQSFALQYVDAEDVLVVARPHLGLATGEMIGIDVSLSADLQGKNIFVTGVEDKVQLIEGLIKAIDQPKESISATDGEHELRTHLVEGGNVRTVYDVLQTLLAGKSVRLSMDETAGSIVALATPAVQQEIAETVTQLQASDAEFAVIQLKTVDPYFAVSLLEEMLDLADLKRRSNAGIEAFTRHGNSRGLEISNVDLDVPKIDADPENMRLFVRAKKQQMDQIKQIVAELDGGNVANNDAFRMVPLRGPQAEQHLETAANFWLLPNPIILYPSATATELKNVERVVATKSTEAATAATVPPSTAAPRMLTDNVHSQAAPIRCQLTPRGLLLQCEDNTALDRFEDHLRTIVGPGDTMPSAPVVFYLKYATPDEAIRMLAELLDGGESVRDAETGALVNGYVSSGSSGSYLSSIVTSREGTVTLMAGSITVVADTRLNRLIAQGTVSDIQRIEDYLSIIDKESSITSIETYGTSHVIELKYTKASEVAVAIREAYAGRVEGLANANSSAQRHPGQGPPQGPSREGEARPQGGSGNQQPGRRPSGDNRSGGGRAQDMKPKMTIAVHERSNSLIVTAPEYLFREVEQLAKMIDARNVQTVEILAPQNAAAMESMVEQILSDQGGTRGSGNAPPNSTPKPQPANNGR